MKKCDVIIPVYKAPEWVKLCVYALCQNTKYIKVQFDEIEVMRHPVNPNFYGVTLLQGWTSNTYHDEGYLFLLWDFTNEEAPQIHVRTWQPDKIGGKPLPKDEIFTLDDFDIR